MPAAWRAHVIGERLAARGVAAEVRAASVHDLQGGALRAVLDAVVRDGAGFPMVLAGEAVACHGGIDMDAIAAAVLRVRPGTRRGRQGDQGCGCGDGCR